MIKIFWFTLWIGTMVFFISYIKIRERIPNYNRERFEKYLMVLLLILLLINCGSLIWERREISKEMNDCIRFYRYFPSFQNDSEFYFINKWCYEYFNPEEIQKLKNAGSTFQEQQLHGENIDFNDLLKGGNITIIENG